MPEYLDPETFGKQEIKMLLDDIIFQMEEFRDSIRRLEFMLEESPNKFDYIENDCKVLLSDIQEAWINSSLDDDVEDLLKEDEEEEEDY